MELPEMKPLKEDVEGRLNAIRNLEGRPNDVIIAAFPRSGTHWVWEITSMLLKQQDDYTQKTKETAFLEFVDDFCELEKMPSPRILNTHLPYRWLPRSHVENKRKVIHVIRNPKDMFVSFYYFQKNFGIELEWNTFFENSVIGQNVSYGGWLGYERSFNRDDENIHVTYYEDLKLKPVEEIRLLAKFLEVKCTDTLLESIAHKCGFDNLKKAHYTVKKTESKMSHYRKGKFRYWKNHFTVAQNEEFDRLFQRKMADLKLKSKFLYE
ncbi:sulfotransferase 1B1-like isoform X1 [Saccostrea echinata]|uniref:sulfotransferase 1B1-like isoform X1 n=1 Tax=Saccostrea echinata TaxID=191078 RepID=UPI002A8177F0|nr:sulfotransferase 1B1-like isoform X1 [Saccostrea echinata]